MKAADSVIGRLVKMVKRFIDGFVEFADYGFRYVDAPWFADNREVYMCKRKEVLQDKKKTLSA